MVLSGKIAIVTGASRGVGASLVEALAREGCSVACAARSTADDPQRTPGTLDETLARARSVATGSAEVIAVPTNLADDEEVAAMVERTAAHFGGVDILINNAAVTFAGDLNQPMRRHDLTMTVNYRAPLIAIRNVMLHMEKRGGGAIINVSSRAALHPLPEMLAYGTSKIALEQLTLHAARELCSIGVAVNCLRIDVPVASEGFIANLPGADQTAWLPPAVPAEGMVWMLRQPPNYSGHRESMYHLAKREGIMRQIADRPAADQPPLQLYDGIWDH